jgi:hypothetical protein
MLLETLERDRRAKCFGEYSALNLRIPGSPAWEPRNSRRYRIRMRPLDQVAERIRRSPAPLVVVKALVESQRLPSMLDAVPGSRAVWAIRHYQDVAASNAVKFGPDLNRINLDPIVRGDRSRWQAEWVPDDLRETVRSLVGPDLTVVDGAALFWYVRNRLYLDLELFRDPRVLLVPYEQLVAEPRTWMARVYAHAGAEPPAVDLCDDVTTASVGKAREVRIAPEIERLCAGLLEQIAERAGVGHAGSRGAEVLPTSADQSAGESH